MDTVGKALGAFLRRSTKWVQHSFIIRRHYEEGSGVPRPFMTGLRSGAWSEMCMIRCIVLIRGP